MESSNSVTARGRSPKGPTESGNPLHHGSRIHKLREMNLEAIVIAVVMVAALYFTITFYFRTAARAINPDYQPRPPFWRRFATQLDALNGGERKTLAVLIGLLVASLIWALANALT